MSHAGHMQGAWPTGCPLPPEDPAKLQGPPVGARVNYRRVRRTGEVIADGSLVWTHEVMDLPAEVIAQSYVWSPGECRHGGGYRRYDWTVIKVFEPEGRTYRVVVDDTDLS